MEIKKGKTIASCSYSRNFWDNAPDTFRGKITWKESGHILWQDHIDIDRLNIDDATNDAVNMAKDYLACTIGI